MERVRYVSGDGACGDGGITKEESSIKESVSGEGEGYADVFLAVNKA